MLDPSLTLAEALIEEAVARRKHRRREMLSLLVFCIGLGFVVLVSYGTDQSMQVREPSVTNLEMANEMETSRSSGTETGVILRLNNRGFGFLQPDKGGEAAFFHVTSLLDGDDSVRPGDVVTYKVTINDRNKKEMCVDIRATGERQELLEEEVEKAFGGGARADFGGGPAANDFGGRGTGDYGRQRSEKVSTGVVTNFVTEKGFGFIQPNDGGESLFWHVRSLLDGATSLSVGDRVRYVQRFYDRTGKEEAQDIRKIRPVTKRGGGVGGAAARPRSSSSSSQAPFSHPSFETAGSVGGGERGGCSSGRRGPSQSDYKHGVVSRLNEERGFGFICPKDGSNDKSDEVFFHIRHVVDGKDKAKPGDVVMFTEGTNDRNGKLEALQVQVVGSGEAAEDGCDRDNLPGRIANISVSSGTAQESGRWTLAGELQDCESIEELYLDWKMIGDAGVDELAAALPRCQNLAKLYLNNNGIGDAGAQVLARALSSCHTLEFLYLRWNTIGDAGAAALAAALPNFGELRLLDITWNQIGNAGQQALTLAKLQQPNGQVEHAPQSGTIA